MKRLLLFACVWGWGLTMGLQGAPQTALSLVRSGDALALSYPGAVGFAYELESSADLVHWDKAGPSRQGAGAPLMEDPIAPTLAAGFFRVACHAVSTDLAPEPAGMSEYLVGTTLQSYRFTAPNRFSWLSEPGNWTYTKQDADSGLLVLTYDSDANNAAIYREEIALTFLTPTSGTLRYSEWTHGVEDPGSVKSQTFNFDLALTPAAFATRMATKIWLGYHFIDGARFERPGPPVDPGDWTYTKTGLHTAVLVFVYDSQGHDPQLYREELVLTFTSAGLLTTGTYRYSEYANGVEDPSTILDNQSFILP